MQPTARRAPVLARPCGLPASRDVGRPKQARQALDESLSGSHGAALHHGQTAIAPQCELCISEDICLWGQCLPWVVSSLSLSAEEVNRDGPTGRVVDIERRIYRAAVSLSTSTPRPKSLNRRVLCLSSTSTRRQGPAAVVLVRETALLLSSAASHVCPYRAKTHAVPQREQPTGASVGADHEVNRHGLATRRPKKATLLSRRWARTRSRPITGRPSRHRRARPRRNRPGILTRSPGFAAILACSHACVACSRAVPVKKQRGLGGAYIGLGVFAIGECGCRSIEDTGAMARTSTKPVPVG